MYIFVYVLRNGNIEKISLSPENLSPYILPRREDYLESDRSLQPDPKDPASAFYWYRYMPGNKILYFQYNQCEDRTTAKRMGNPNWQSAPDFGLFSQRLIDAINNHNVNKLIVDLRWNMGGDSDLMTKLAAKLSRITKLQKKGKVFVIVGRDTFSSGVWAAVDMMVDFPEAVILGEPTGGDAGGYGEVGSLTLPYSHLHISYSEKYWSSYRGYKGELIPDVTVHQSYADYARGIDDVYKAIENYQAPNSR